MISELMAMSRVAGISQTYVDDVFSSFLYTGNGSTQTITNGIDLAGKGGMVWTKGRDAAKSHDLVDTMRGATYRIVSNGTGAQNGNSDTTSFNSSGYGLGYVSGDGNQNLSTYASWTFRKAPKFFDVVTYTGNGANRTISHSLGAIPGMIAVKRTDVGGSWMVYHNSIANTENLVLNTTAAKVTDATAWNSTTATASVFSLGTHADVNTNAGTYVAYLFAHDTSATGLIQCGSFTTDGSGNATVTLGWEPQFLLIKQNSSAGGFENWHIVDSIRGFPVTAGTGSEQVDLKPNSSIAEAGFAAYGFDPLSTGFIVQNGGFVSQTMYYLAIRRSNKPPTIGTQVYNAIARTGTGAAATVTGVGFAPDLLFASNRAAGNGFGVFDRLRGAGQWLRPPATDSEAYYVNSVAGFDVMDGIRLGTDVGFGNINSSSETYINHFFRRAPGFFDEVCYKGNGVSGTTQPHGLGVVAELVIIKGRTSVDNWGIWCAAAPTKDIYLNLGGSYGSSNTATSSSTTITLQGMGGTNAINASGITYVAYLFATLAGTSKVGSYTGNGTSQTINCGFATGARFILIKRTDSLGNWYIWDTVRGIAAGNDPHLSLNTTAAEVATDDSIDPDTSGFIVNQLAATDINVTSATYIFLAVA